MRGDTRDMVRARRRVFERGLFEPLAEVIAREAAQETVRDGFTVLDAGCGDGYYVGRAARAIEERDPADVHCCIGVDLSKDALRLAGRANRGVCFLVNDLRHTLTVADASIDVLLDGCAPRNAAELARVVRDGGLLLVVIPTANHLRELRERLPLLGIEEGKRQRAID